MLKNDSISLPALLLLMVCAAGCAPAERASRSDGLAVGALEGVGLEVTAIGKSYTPEAGRVAALQREANMGGSTSVRNVDRPNLEWKRQGYFQRNRDLGQVFTPERDFRLEAIVLRTGPSDKAVLSGTPGARVFIQFFEVDGAPRINDNGTPPGTEATHGFTKNHRADDFVDGVRYRSIGAVRGGVFPEIPPTHDGTQAVNGDAGKLHYMRWRLTRRPMTFQAGRRYAFMIGFEEPGEGYGFTLANANAAGVDAPPSMADEHDRYGGGWGLRREGDGSVPPTMVPGEEAPAGRDLERLSGESLFATGEGRWALSPTTDGYPDVDTYRDLEFALEVEWLGQGPASR